MVFNIGKTLDKEFKTWKGKKMTKHTQGPWILKQPNEYGTVCINTPDGYPLAIVSQYSGDHKKQSDANACLIAAAPELLAALEVCLEAIQPYYDSDDDGSLEAKASNMALAAINKAKGL